MANPQFNGVEAHVKVLFPPEAFFRLFTQTTEYALRAVAHLAAQPDCSDTIPRMSEAVQVGAAYLRKVLNYLRKAGIVATQRGSGGGVRLAARAEEITILDVVNAVDPVARIERCPLGLSDHLQLCPLHAELDEALSQIERVLGRRTIAQLLAARRGPAQCGFPKIDDLYQL